MTPPILPATHSTSAHAHHGHPPERRPHDLRPWQILLLFVACLGLVSIPILTHPIPPLSDYVNHLARMHVIASIPGDQDLARFYTLKWSILPNLMMDLLVPVIDKVVGIYTAGEIYTLMCFALIAGGTMTLNRTLFGVWSALPLLAFPLLYSGVFLIGVMNYYFGIGLALFALSAWVALRDKWWPWRYLVSAAFVVALFFCHLFTAGIYGIGILAYELNRLRLGRGPIWPRIGVFVSGGLPFLPIVPLLLASPTWGLSGQNYWEPQGKIAGIELIFNVYIDHVAVAVAAIFIVAGVWAARHRLLYVHSFMLPLLLVAGLVYLAMPRVVFATYMADQRLPAAIVFMVLAAMRVDLRHRFARRGFAVVLILMLAVRVGEVQVVWDRLSQWTVAFRESVTHIRPGSRVLVAYADIQGGNDPTDLGLMHAACLAMIEKSSLVTTAFTVEGKQVLRARKPFNEQVDTEDGTPPQTEQLLITEEDPTPDGPRYWDLWPSKFDYVYLLFTERGAPNPDSDRLKLIAEGERFQLYEVVPRPPAPALLSRHVGRDVTSVSR